MLKITGIQLRQVVPTLTVDRANRLADMINYQCPKYGIDNLDILHEFIARLAHESGGFMKKEENLNYSAQGLLDTFGKKYFVNIIAAKRYERQPEKIANYVYGGRMGNNVPGDGWKFRGGGFAHLTGKDMYESYRKHVVFDTVENLANAVRTDDYWALDSACWFFAKKSALIQLAIDDKLKELVQRWNGGLNGLDDTENYYERAVKYLI